MSSLPLPYQYFFFVGSENNSLYVYYKGLSKQLMTYKFDTVRSVLVRKKNFCWSTFPSTCKFCMCLFVHPFVKMTAAFTMESLSQGLHELFWYCNCCCQIFISRIAQSILGWRELTCQMKVYGDMSKIHFHWQLGTNLPWNYLANFTPLLPSTN